MRIILGLIYKSFPNIPLSEFKSGGVYRHPQFFLAITEAERVAFAHLAWLAGLLAQAK